MLDLRPHIDSFFDLVRDGEVEIYNEFSLQHELGIHLRTCCAGSGLTVQFERPVGHFCSPGTRTLKKEIDITIFGRDRREPTAIELKFPNNGQYPEQMFKACCDIAFLEQLLSAGFASGYFVIVCADRLFYEGADHGGIYSHFRGGKLLWGTIQKPTGARSEEVAIRGKYAVKWKSAGNLHYAVIEVER